MSKCIHIDRLRQSEGLLLGRYLLSMLEPPSHSTLQLNKAVVRWDHARIEHLHQQAIHPCEQPQLQAVKDRRTLRGQWGT